MRRRIRRALRAILGALGLRPFARKLGERWSPAAFHHRVLMRRFYSAFIKPGDLVFDVGANVGDRAEIFLALGARVVAIEPQERCWPVLRRRFGRSKNFTLIGDALGAEEGEGVLMLASASTVSSMAPEWVESVTQSGRFAEIEWRGRQPVHVTTLDRVIADHGLPVFCKIDVEGYEQLVLAGLTRKIPVISFEFTPEYLDAFRQCVDRLEKIGYTGFNYSFGESMKLDLPSWIDCAEMRRLLDDATFMAFGDAYAR